MQNPISMSNLLGSLFSKGTLTSLIVVMIGVSLLTSICLFNLISKHNTMFCDIDILELNLSILFLLLN